MTIQKLASAIAFAEGKGSQARIGDIREILGILADITYLEVGNEDMGHTLFLAGEKRFKRKPKKKPAFRGGSKKRA